MAPGCSLAWFAKIVNAPSNKHKRVNFASVKSCGMAMVDQGSAILKVVMLGIITASLPLCSSHCSHLAMNTLCEADKGPQCTSPEEALVLHLALLAQILPSLPQSQGLTSMDVSLGFHP
mmetsp:Transcript_7003/g.42964  ORF Transcript_7003/g.42964 Transcript_7003/m.42964 type:complete len:119 (+) Transcript_7003:3459-3815(+)